MTVQTIRVWMGNVQTAMTRTHAPVTADTSAKTAKVGHCFQNTKSSEFYFRWKAVSNVTTSGTIWSDSIREPLREITTSMHTSMLQLKTQTVPLWRVRTEEDATTLMTIPRRASVQFATQEIHVVNGTAIICRKNEVSGSLMLPFWWFNQEEKNSSPVLRKQKHRLLSPDTSVHFAEIIVNIAEVLASCGVAAIPPNLGDGVQRIVGGTKAEKGSWPWMALLIRDVGTLRT